jgi:hypothetical protein
VSKHLFIYAQQDLPWIFTKAHRFQIECRNNYFALLAGRGRGIRERRIILDDEVETLTVSCEFNGQYSDCHCVGDQLFTAYESAPSLSRLYGGKRACVLNDCIRFAVSIDSMKKCI